MPFEMVYREPELVFEHKGVKVHRAYDDDDYNDPLLYWFRIYEDEELTTYTELDLRDLEPYRGLFAKKYLTIMDPEVIDMLKSMIDAGKLGLKESNQA